jgi:hypothetical protein
MNVLMNAAACDVAGNAIETGEYEWQLREF